MVALSLCYSNINCNNSILYGSKIHKIPWSPLSGYSQTLKYNHHQQEISRRRWLTVVAVTEGSAKKSRNSENEEEDEAIPSWARADSNEPPPWARNEGPKNSSESVDLPFSVYLLASAITAIAAIGSIFEYINQKPVFGLVDSDSIFYAPILGFFAITGVPTSGFLWYKSVQAANKEAEEQDKRDGYL